MKTSAPKIVRSGTHYLTWLGGWSKNIDNAMFVKDNIVLGKNQELLDIQVVRRIEILDLED